MNEEFLVSASHQLALITSLPFVHTARRYYRLNGLVRSPDWRRNVFIDALDAEKLLKLDHLEEAKVQTHPTHHSRMVADFLEGRLAPKPVEV